MEIPGDYYRSEIFGKFFSKPNYMDMETEAKDFIRECVGMVASGVVVEVGESVYEQTAWSKRAAFTAK